MITFSLKSNRPYDFYFSVAKLLVHVYFHSVTQSVRESRPTWYPGKNLLYMSLFIAYRPCILLCK